MGKLRPFAENIWIAESDVKLIRGVKLPLRMTVIRYNETDLMVISPITPTPELVRDLQEVGTVRCIVAPNCMHHLHVKKFAAAFGGAEIWGPKDLHDKRADIPFTHVLEGSQNTPWREAVEMISLHANPPLFEEVIFFHHASKTAIVTDMLFNLHKFNNLLEKLVAKLNGTYKRLTMSRLVRTVFKDRESLHTVAARMLTWNPDHLIMAHGEVIRGNAHLALRAPLSEFAGTNS